MINFVTRRCDADPVALAKYVLALVKKEKPIPQLQASMENSLDVFLQKGMQNHNFYTNTTDVISKVC